MFNTDLELTIIGYDLHTVTAWGQLLTILLQIKI